MSFGKRRFDRVILQAGLPVARFLPLDMGAPCEYADEATLRRLLGDNERESCPLDAPEEALALTALEILAKKNTNTHPTKSALAKRTRDAKKGS